MLQTCPPPRASRSAGGTNFGEGYFIRSKAASTNGLCLPKPSNAADSFSTTSRPITPASPAEEHRHPQRYRLPIRRVRRRLLLIETQQVEGEDGLPGGTAVDYDSSFTSFFAGIPATGCGGGVDHRKIQPPNNRPHSGQPRCQPRRRSDDKSGDTAHRRRN